MAVMVAGRENYLHGNGVKCISSFCLVFISATDTCDCIGLQQDMQRRDAELQLSDMQHATPII